MRPNWSHVVKLRARERSQNGKNHTNCDKITMAAMPFDFYKCKPCVWILEPSEWSNIYNIVVRITSKRARETKMPNSGALIGGEALSPAAQLFQSPSLNCYIVTMIGFKTKINPNFVKAGLEQTLLKHPLFSSKIVRKISFHKLRKKPLFSSLLLYSISIMFSSKCLILVIKPVQYHPLFHFT